MVEGLLKLGADSVSVADLVSRTSDLISGVICSWEVGGKHLLTGLVGGVGQDW